MRQKPSELLTVGLYRFSRNPTYVSLSLLYIGVALLIQSAAILIFFIPCFLLVDRFVIPNEELNLEAAFGDKYLVYKASTRRWL